LRTYISAIQPNANVLDSSSGGWNQWNDANAIPTRISRSLIRNQEFQT